MKFLDVCMKEWIMIFSTEAIADMPTSVLPGSPLWSFKHTLEQLRVLELGDPYTFSSQMQQNPNPLGGGMFKDKYWKYYDVLPTKGIFLVDLVRGKWEAPELESVIVEFWNKHMPTQFKPFGAQLVKIEDKSSGSSLIQSIQRDYMIPIEPIQRNTDKVLRAMGVVKYFASGFIHIPRDRDWVHDFKDEFRKFTPLMTHKHDDQIDPAMDAVEDLLVFEDMIYSESSM